MYAKYTFEIDMFNHIRDISGFVIPLKKVCRQITGTYYFLPFPGWIYYNLV